MGKPSIKKILIRSKSGNGNTKQGKGSDRSSKPSDEESAVFINMSQELKEEGNKLFQKRDHEGAMLKYEKALKLLPENHIDMSYLRTNMAACYMQLGIGEYPRAINQCNLALQVAPKYGKALLKRARCYEALNRLDLALRDANSVLTVEPNNVAALEISNRVKSAIEKKGIPVEDKEVILPTNYGKIEEEKIVMKSVKLVNGEDIRWAQLPLNCDIRIVRDIVLDRFPNLKGVLVKYKDEEGDLVTITTTNELRVAEGLADPRGILRLYIAEVSPDKEPLYDGKVIEENEVRRSVEKPTVVVENDNVVKVEKRPFVVEDWIVKFAGIFRNHVGFDSDSNLNLHDMEMKFCSEAIEDTVTTEDAQPLLEIAGSKFHEMTALALFNWGNIHLSKARKRPAPIEDCCAEYAKAGSRYEEALRIKPDFYEGFLALSQQQFEQARLFWYSKMRTSAEVLDLYNKAEDSMEKGMQIWDEIEEQRLNGPSKFGLEDGISKDASVDETANMRSRVYLLWGTMLYERSIVEFKSSLPTWEECLEVAVEKFELGGALPEDIAVIIKNHCSNETALQGFKVDEIVQQARYETYGADRWRSGASSFRLEPLFRRHSPELHSVAASLSNHAPQ